MLQGTVKWFNDAKGFGFIQVDGGGKEDIFVHHTQITMTGFKSLREGQRVQFTTENSPKGLSAVNVIPS